MHTPSIEEPAKLTPPIRCDLILAIFLASAFAIACTSPPPRSEALHSARSKADVEIFLALEPDMCVPSGPGLELCSWRSIGNQHPSWKALSREVGTRARVNVMCEFSMPDGLRSQEMCTIHAVREKDFYQYEGSRRTREATKILAEARTIGELSRLVGDIPNRCVAAEQYQQRCVWLLTGRTEGRAVLVATIRRYDTLARLTCRLPLDGSPRTGDSCVVESQ